MIYSGLLLCAMALLSACDKDNNNENVDFINQDVAGTYSGTFDITMSGAPLAQDVQKDIVIAKVGEGVVSLTLKDFTLDVGTDMGPMPLGTSALSNCAVTQSNDSYTIKGNETITLDFVGDCPTEVSGTVKDGALDLTIDVTAPMVGAVKVSYVGTRKKASA
jgi:hypothetical protein